MHRVLGSVVAIATAAAALGAAFVAPLETGGLIAALALLGLALALASRLRAVFLVVVTGLLAGYAFGSRAFAYVGYPPLFVGEAVLAFGIVVTVMYGDWSRLFRSPICWAIVAFCAWGVVCTVPFVGTWGVDALRDGVIWGYAAFALTLIACARYDRLSVWLGAYRRLAPVFVLSVPCVFLLDRYASDVLPVVPLVWFKPGDAGVHLAGIGAFLLLQLGHVERRRWRGASLALTIAWVAAAAIVSSLNRGAFVAVAAALVVAGLLEARTAGRRLMRLAAPAGAALLFFVLFSAPAAVPVLDGERVVSFSQFAANLRSFATPTDHGDLDDTRSWRLEWWRDIVGYTVFGAHFWTGKGFGVNLADDDNYQVTIDGSLRSPHSIHATVLARMGVPGVLLWGLVNCVFVGSLLVGHYRARRAGIGARARVLAWLLAYWAALITNASFDVFIESPQGGIWFWCILGLGAVALQGPRQPAPGRAAREGVW